MDAATARAENPFQGFIAGATNIVLNESGLPAVPSEHHEIAVSEVHDAKVTEILTRLNRIFLKAQKIQFTQAPVHNVFMDTQRKIIISDPEFFAPNYRRPRRCSRRPHRPRNGALHT